ncbi:MAG: helix-turn-helix domain-containing protein [Acidobacteria bacterium]|nr:helix-turn-helix domain-containing protein [Acidobacteriota bacterium]
MNLGESIRKIRQTKGLSQGEMQKRTGILRSYLSRVENGHTIPSLATLQRLAVAMEVTLADFFPTEGAPPATVPADGPPQDPTDARAAQLLRRYGVVTRELLAREPMAPPWWRLVRAYRRAEARGEVRGGRFVAGFVGEQFALPEAVDALRAVHRRERTGEVVRLSACDPLNLVGILTPGPRIPAVIGNEVLYRDGVPIEAEAAAAASA